MSLALRANWNSWRMRLLSACLASVVLTPWVASTLERLDERRVRWASLLIAPPAMLSFVGGGNIHQSNDLVFWVSLRLYVVALLFTLLWLGSEAVMWLKAKRGR